MIFRKLIDRKNRYATCLLAIVIFLSGFSFSLSTEYVKEGPVKAKTELVVSAKTKSKKSFCYKQFATSFPIPKVWSPFSATYFIHFQNDRYRILFNKANKTHQDFFPLLATRHFLSKIPEDNLSYLLG